MHWLRIADVQLYGRSKFDKTSSFHEERLKNDFWTFDSASDDFNNGVVLTRRPLRPNEIFQVRLERVVTKWAGSIEVGVTTHSPNELEFPFTMTNVR